MNALQLSDRRAYNTTDDTVSSLTPSFSEEIQFNNHASHILATGATAQETLKVFLSSGTVVSTTSSFARRHDSAQFDLDAQLYSEIGNGSYGAIFERPGTLEVVKRPINHRDPRDNPHNLWNDFIMHKIVYESFIAGKCGNVHIPRPLQFISADDNEWWSIWRTKFEDQVATNLLFTERILPVPQPVRDALADCFCPEEFRNSTKQSIKNKHCLIHPLLGRRKGRSRMLGALNLRNFELCVDQMEFLGLDVNSLIDCMAESLAILHFRAHVDAHDIEFVFGTAPTPMHNNCPPSWELEKMAQNSTVIPSAKGLNFHGRVVHLWMLDFNRVSKIPDQGVFVEMALKGFADQSKAYYPRPRFHDNDPNDTRNWKRFKSVYTQSSRVILENKLSDLPDRFLEAVEQHYRKASQPRRGRNQ